MYGSSPVGSIVLWCRGGLNLNIADMNMMISLVYYNFSMLLTIIYLYYGAVFVSSLLNKIISSDFNSSSVLDGENIELL